jgi:hypothetical protein
VRCAHSRQLTVSLSNLRAKLRAERRELPRQGISLFARLAEPQLCLAEPLTICRTLGAQRCVGALGVGARELDKRVRLVDLALQRLERRLAAEHRPFLAR